MKTVMQPAIATGNSPAPNHAAAIHTMRAAAPATGDWVASMMAGKVMTARVTYGT